MLKNIIRSGFIFIFFTILVLSLYSGAAPVQAASSVGSAVTFSCSDEEDDISAKLGARVTSGNAAIYVGYQQVSSKNKNPIAIRFDSGTKQWCRTDYEVTGDDNTGYGLFWDGTNDGLYGVFSATGTQGSSSEDFRRFATGGWLRHYTDGSTGGGGAKVAIIARIDPANGDVLTATFLTARLPSSGKTNSLAVKDLWLDGDHLVVNANSWYSPRNIDKTHMDCSGDSPFDYTVRLRKNLSTAVTASAVGCTGNEPQPPDQVTVSPPIGFVGDNTFWATVEPSNVQLPITFTWEINDSPVRTQVVNDRIDKLTHNWPSEISNQKLKVIVNNSKAVELGLPAEEAVYTFNVVEAKRTYLPLVMKN